MWDGSNATGSRDIPLPNLGNFTSGQTDHADLRSFETVTGRLGFLVTRTLMFYGVGGMAWVQNRSAVTEAQGAGGVGPALGEIFTSNNTRTGCDAGAGLSWMLVPNWELWVEYDHMGFGTKTIPMRGEGAFTGFVEGFDQTLNVDKVLVGLNWRF